MNIDLDDDVFDEAIYHAVFAIVQDEVEHNQDRKQYWYTALLGSEYVDELLNSKHLDRIRQVLHMQLDTFYALQD